MSRIPDFFIIGAPKCGTTSLAAWLADHPRVHMAHPKEPSFFDTDSPRVGVRRLDHYLRCFNGANDQHLAVGEASPNYLHSQVAVGAIREFNPSARVVVALRDPVRMAPSLHAQLFYNQHEDLADFTAAWNAQERRRHGIDLPQHCRLPQFLQYREACALGTQLARVYQFFGRDRVHVVLLDDIEADAQREYQRILQFLGVPDDGRSQFAVYNAASARGDIRTWLPARNFGYLKQRLGVSHFSLRDWTHRPPVLPSANVMRATLPPALRQELVDAFAGEVQLLESMLGRDLHSLWNRATTTPLTKEENVL